MRLIVLEAPNEFLYLAEQGVRVRINCIVLLWKIPKRPSFVDIMALYVDDTLGFINRPIVKLEIDVSSSAPRVLFCLYIARREDKGTIRCIMNRLLFLPHTPPPYCFGY